MCVSVIDAVVPHPLAVYQMSMSSSSAASAPSAQAGPINPDDLRLGDHIKPLRDDELKTAILKDGMRSIMMFCTALSMSELANLSVC